LVGFTCKSFQPFVGLGNITAIFFVTWARVTVRVAGSWIVAIGLLMLGWSVRVPG
jgi:hypothetical protein